MQYCNTAPLSKKAQSKLVTKAPTNSLKSHTRKSHLPSGKVWPAEKQVPSKVSMLLVARSATSTGFILTYQWRTRGDKVQRFHLQRRWQMYFFWVNLHELKFPAFNVIIDFTGNINRYISALKLNVWNYQLWLSIECLQGVAQGISCTLHMVAHWPAKLKQKSKPRIPLQVQWGAMRCKVGDRHSASPL